MHNLRRKTFIQSSNNSNYLGCISILPRQQSHNTALLILSKTIEGLPHDTLFHSNSIFCFWSIQFKSGRDPACCTLSCLSDAILMRSKAKCHARLTVAHFAFVWRYSFSVHPSPSPRAISGYKDLRESPLNLTSGLHFLWFHIVTPCCSLIHLSMNLFPYFIHWVRLGYKCLESSTPPTKASHRPSFQLLQIALPMTLHILACLFYISSLPSFSDSQ